ncbi:hypothetical protein GIB67_029905 [Kingdonia uniflora]|uniref:Uncharacterized protein n=1 Tax=Kingdonia uniflora TaxID=39325 RepID=A0A7J7P5V2_9MAGN|nr:hypothetical protein GIB67_029905 [Kingdonia uniflora]
MTFVYILVYIFYALNTCTFFVVDLFFTEHLHACLAAVINKIRISVHLCSLHVCHRLTFGVFSIIHFRVYEEFGVSEG